MHKMSSPSLGEANVVPYVVHGSFRNHLGVIQSTITTINATGLAAAIAPHDCTAVNETDGFILLQGEQDKDPRLVEAEYLQKVLSLRALGGFSLWVTPGGYIGKSGAYEYGIAQACGVPAFFTETPQDVPFYVPPESVRSAAELAEQLQGGRNVIRVASANDPIGEVWERLAFPTASVAVGGIVRFRNRLLLVNDGRWPNDQLTVPGTTVRVGETREEALRRVFREKTGATIRGVTAFQINFMVDGSGYGKPVNNLVFDDRIIDLSGQRVEPRPGLSIHWVGNSEAQSLARAGQIEPNAASLLREYWASVA